MRSILNKLLLIIILLQAFRLVSTERRLGVDTVNARKEFFYNENNWEKYINKEVIKQVDNKKICITAQVKGNLLAISFAPIIEGSSQALSNYGRIDYIFTKSKKLLEVKVYFIENRGSYLLFNTKRKNSFDIKLFGDYYRKNLPYYFEFESLKYLPLNSILSVLKLNKIDDELLITKSDALLKYRFIEKVVFPLPEEIDSEHFEKYILTSIKDKKDLNFIKESYIHVDYEHKYVLDSKLSLAARERLKKLLLSSTYMGNFNDDGARNRFGEFVYIDSELPQESNIGFNCSGFVKEVADNYIRLYNPAFKWLPLKDLKKKRLDERNKTSYARFEYSHDPYFGYDWVNNIVDQVNEKCGFNAIRAKELNNDRYAAYFEKSGYYMYELENILYRDQQFDANTFYIIVFNRQRKVSPYIPEFYHISVLVPYFNNKKFVIRTFESGVETGYSSMIKNHLPDVITYNNFVNNILERIPNEADKEFVKNHYRFSNRRYRLKQECLTDADAIRIMRIFTKIEFITNKVQIFKVPIPFSRFM